MCRADSAYYGWAFVGTAIRHGAWFSVTARMDPKIKAAITGIDEAAWVTIKYPKAVCDEVPRWWVSDAEVAEVPYIAFTGRRTTEHVPCRLVVRRVRRLQPLASDGSVQGELFATWRHHAFITNSTLGTFRPTRSTASTPIVEQVIAELKDGPLAHLPSGKYAANAAWVAHTVIAFNLARAAAVAAGHAPRPVGQPAHPAHHHPRTPPTTGRRLVLHLPHRWPWQHAWHNLCAAATGPPQGEA